MTICFNPFPTYWRWRWQRKIKNRDRLPLSPAATDRDDLIAVVYIHSLNACRRSENLRHEWASQIHLNHRQQSDSLLGLAVGVDDRLFNECVEPALIKSLAS